MVSGRKHPYLRWSQNSRRPYLLFDQFVFMTQKNRLTATKHAFRKELCKKEESHNTFAPAARPAGCQLRRALLRTHIPGSLRTRRPCRSARSFLHVPRVDCAPVATFSRRQQRSFGVTKLHTSTTSGEDFLRPLLPLIWTCSFQKGQQT